MKSGKNIPNTEKHKLLATQIRVTEQQIIDRQQRVDIRMAHLVNNLHQQMAAPATLVLAGGAGFILGELTYRPPKIKRRSTQPTAAANPDADSTLLKKAVNFMSLAQGVYQLLPLVLIMDTFYPKEVSKSAHSTEVKKVKQ